MTAPSNVAVDNLTERLVEKGVKTVRIGHPARILEKLHPHSLDFLARESGIKVQMLYERIAEVRNALKMKNSPASSHKKERNVQMADLREELKSVNKALTAQKKLWENEKKKYLENRDVVCGTLTGCKTTGPLKLLPADWFQLTVIDEAGQALEMACWIVVHRAPKLILAGDHLQVPPTVLSKKAEKELSVTLMERIMERDGIWTERFGGGIWSGSSRMLTMQYRMNWEIMDWPSKKFYWGKLYAAEEVANQRYGTR